MPLKAGKMKASQKWNIDWKLESWKSETLRNEMLLIESWKAGKLKASQKWNVFESWKAGKLKASQKWNAFDWKLESWKIESLSEMKYPLKSRKLEIRNS